MLKINAACGVISKPVKKVVCYLCFNEGRLFCEHV